MILRVFPSITKATPNDANVRTGMPTMFDEADEIHISVTFSWDIKFAEALAKQWEQVAPVKMGGPAMGQPGGEFNPGFYLKNGYTITSRGCPNKCWFCSVWKRDGHKVKELEIKDGHKVQDDNLLACSDSHIKNVFKMLKKQLIPIELAGLEAARLKEWHVEEMMNLNLGQLFFAYDTPGDYQPLLAASKILKNYGIINKNSHVARCYVLIGFPKDTIAKAEIRLNAAMRLGYMPFAMLYRDNNGYRDFAWKRFQREWANPIIVGSKMNKIQKG